MRAGTIVRLADGREGTVVYNHLDGVGIRWGRVPVTPEDVRALQAFESGDEWAPEAMLRAPYPGAWCECVGGDYQVVACDQR